MSIQVETIMSPSLFNQVQDLDKKIVVVIDVLRASSTICTILENGAESVRTVGSVEEAQTYRDNGFIVGGERGGKKVEGFDFGNSPFDYKTELVQEKEVVLTTTNGTKCIEMGKPAKGLIIGSFLNLGAVCDYLDEANSDIVLFCAGWRDRVNLEDSLFAGAVCHGLNGDYLFDDASLLCQSAYQLAEYDLYRHMQQSSHFERLSKHGVDKDIEYCCEVDQILSVPVLDNGKLKTL
ncbi:MAG: 2-phosphosulfolactate phosphatase [Bacteroidia bacterium]